MATLLILTQVFHLDVHSEGAFEVEDAVKVGAILSPTGWTLGLPENFFHGVYFQDVSDDYLGVLINGTLQS